MSFDFFRLEQMDAAPYVNMTYPMYSNFIEFLNGSFIAVGARCDGKPAGLCLASLDSEMEEADICSVFVEKEYRRQHVALHLVERMLQEIPNTKKVFVTYETNRNYTEAIKKICEKCGFSEPKVKSIVGRNHTQDILHNAPWLQNNYLPENYEIFLWKDLTEEEKQDIIARKDTELKYPYFLDPFITNACEPLNSLGLRRNGKIIGWIINDRIAPDTIRYSSIFIQEEYQQYGLSLPLLIESMKIQLSHYFFDMINKSVFIVNVKKSPAMAKFVERKMKPYLNVVNYYMEVEKTLIFNKETT